MPCETSSHSHSSRLSAVESLGGAAGDVKKLSPSKNRNHKQPAVQYGTNVRVSVCASQGGRKYMEDRVHVHCERHSLTHAIEYMYFAVYDGHGGSQASDYTREHLLRNITSNDLFRSATDADVLEAIRAGFMKTHLDMLKVVDEWPKTASGYRSTSGTTASVAFVMRSKLYTGHVGDSAIILGKRDTDSEDNEIIAERLTIDHKPDAPEELRRIEQRGGQVLNKAGVMRVVWRRTIRGHEGPIRRSTPQESIPFLAVARSLGDLWSYNPDTEEFVVSPEPDLHVQTLGPDDLCIVLGSDGLWNVIRDQYSIAIIDTHEWKELEEKGIDGPHLDRAVHANHSRWLVRHALRSWGFMRADNITAITVIFDTPGSELSPDASCVLDENVDMDLEHVFTTFPDAMLRITPNTIQQLRTAPVELIYNGAMDPIPSPTPYSNGVQSQRSQMFHVSWKGPGFTVTTDGRSSYTSSNSGSILSTSLTTKTTTNERQGSNETESVQKSKTNHNGAENIADQDSSDLEDATVPSSPVTVLEDTESFELTVRTDDNDDSAAPPAKKKFICQKHGFDCDHVKHMNDKDTPQQNKDAQTQNGCRTISPRSTSRTEQTNVNGHVKHHHHSPAEKAPKYFCSKHGLTCEKVRRMNAAHFNSLVVEQQQKDQPNASNDAEASATNTNNPTTTPAAAAVVCNDNATKDDSDNSPHPPDPKPSSEAQPAHETRSVTKAKKHSTTPVSPARQSRLAKALFTSPRARSGARRRMARNTRHTPPHYNLRRSHLDITPLAGKATRSAQRSSSLRAGRRTTVAQRITSQHQQQQSNTKSISPETPVTAVTRHTATALNISSPNPTSSTTVNQPVTSGSGSTNAVRSRRRRSLNNKEYDENIERYEELLESHLAMANGDTTDKNVSVSERPHSASDGIESNRDNNNTKSPIVAQSGTSPNMRQVRLTRLCGQSPTAASVFARLNLESTRSTVVQSVSRQNTRTVLTNGSNAVQMVTTVSDTQTSAVFPVAKQNGKRRTFDRSQTSKSASSLEPAAKRSRFWSIFNLGGLFGGATESERAAD